MATSASVALKTLFIILTSIMAAALVYLIIMDRFSSCFDLNAWWTQAAVTHVLICFFFVVVWLFYKESSWITRIIFIVLIYFCGSFITCGYIVIQFFKLSREEALKDPLYFVLVRHKKGDVRGHTRGPSVVIGKVVVAVLGCCSLGILIYAFIVDGLPFHNVILTPCMITSIIDINIHVVVFAVWITYKESSRIYSVFWILLLVCFGSVALCVYVLRQLFYLLPEQPVSLILFNQSNKDSMSTNPLLTENSNV